MPVVIEISLELQLCPGVLDMKKRVLARPDVVNLQLSFRGFLGIVLKKSMALAQQPETNL
jgi:hypothetical protein